MKQSFTALIILLLLCPFAGSAQFRKYSNEFLNIGAGARGLAMGNAQVASANDATAGYWNPAGLVGVKDHLTQELCTQNILPALQNTTMHH